MSNVKGKGQRLIPEELLKYLEALKNKYPDAVDIVEANPTLEGDEESLSSVLINGIKYAVGGGSGSTYRHFISFENNDMGRIICDIDTTDNTPFTLDTLKSYLAAEGHSGSFKPYECSCSYVGTWNFAAIGIFTPSSATKIGIVYLAIVNNAIAVASTEVLYSTITNFTDVVTEV